MNNTLWHIPFESITFDTKEGWFMLYNEDMSGKVNAGIDKYTDRESC